MFTFIHKLGTSLKWTINHRPGHLMMFFHWIAVRHFQFFIALIHCLTSFLGSLYQQSSMICGDINHNFGVSKCSCHHDIRRMSEAWNEETGLTAGFLLPIISSLSFWTYAWIWLFVYLGCDLFVLFISFRILPETLYESCFLFWI